MLKLKLQYSGHVMQGAISSEKTLMLGKIEGKKKRATEDTMIELHHCLSGHEFQQTLGDSEEQGSLAAAVHGVTKSWTQLSD